MMSLGAPRAAEGWAWGPIAAGMFEGVGGGHALAELSGLLPCVLGCFYGLFWNVSSESEVRLQFLFPESVRKGAWGWPSDGCHGSPTSKPYGGGG